MGLDQFAYTRANQKEPKQWEDRGREIAYWRKHPNLQGWMERLWTKRNPERSNEGNDMFNGVELELGWEDLDNLERDIKSGTVARLDTKGFFFGDPSDDYYNEKDLEFIKQARAELFMGLRVFYNSSW